MDVFLAFQTEDSTSKNLNHWPSSKILDLDSFTVFRSRLLTCLKRQLALHDYPY
jgi:hypothetical protein